MSVQSSLLNELSVSSDFTGYSNDEVTSELVKIIREESFVTDCPARGQSETDFQRESVLILKKAARWVTVD
ncbi:MAG: hypothetical protein U5K84_00090 [Alkalibacterium sp.]|nr:hypothetical protein [Alkalibacterium sp.]